MSIDATQPFVPARSRANRPDDGTEVSIATGTIVGRFVVIGKLGQGATSEVYEAHDPELDRSVAIKILRRGDGAQPSVGRLQREARALAKLSHPNVVGAFEVGMFGDRVFLALELVRGHTLAAWCRRGGHRPHAVLEVFIAAARGLAAVHAVGLVHRDFKPDNVLIGDDARVRVTDFGLARAPKPAMHRASTAGAPTLASVAVTVTHEAGWIGTPLFAAPEAYGGATALTPAADVYAFCSSLYWALYGVPPFDEDDPERLVAAKRTNPLALPKMPKSSKGRRVPGWVPEVLRRGLEPDPSRRFADMQAVLRAIDRGQRRRRRRQWLAASAAAVVAGGVIASAVHFAAVRSCETLPSEFEPLWSDADARSIRARFVASGVAQAEEHWADVDATLRAYRSSAADEWQGACLATRVDGSQDERTLQLARSCLRDRYDAALVLVDVFADANAPHVERSSDLSAMLPAIDDCARAELLPFIVPESARADTRALRKRLRNVEMRMGTTDPQAALEEAYALLARAEALADQALLAETELAISQFSENVSATGDALEHARRGILAARRAPAPLLEAQMWTQLAWLQKTFSSRNEDAWQSTEHALAALSTVGRHPVTEAWIETERAGIEMSAGKFEQARARASRALELLEQQPHRKRRAIAHQLIGMCLCRLERYDEGIEHIERAIEIDSRRVAVNVGAQLQSLARCTTDAGRPEQALPIFAEAERVLAQTLPPEHPHRLAVQMNWSQALSATGRHEQALEHAELALVRVDVAKPAHDRARSSARFLAAIELRHLERWPRAIALVAEGLALLEEHEPQNTLWIAYHRNLLAEIEADAGRKGDAARNFEAVFQMTAGAPDLQEQCSRAGQGWAAAVQALGRHRESERVRARVAQECGPSERVP